MVTTGEILSGPVSTIMNNCFQLCKRAAKCFEAGYNAKPGEATTNQRRTTRVLIADDDPLARLLIRNVLQRRPNFEIAGEAEDGTEAVALVRRAKPDVLLLDLLMPRLPGMDTLRELALGDIPVMAIVLCAAIGKRQIVEALQLGARGILLKKSINRLTECIDAVTGGFYWVEDRRLKDVAEVIRSWHRARPNREQHKGTT